MAKPRPACAGLFAKAFFVPNTWLGASDGHLRALNEREVDSNFLCGFVIGVHAWRMRCDEERELWWR